MPSDYASAEIRTKWVDPTPVASVGQGRVGMNIMDEYKSGPLHSACHDGVGTKCSVGVMPTLCVLPLCPCLWPNEHHHCTTLAGRRPQQTHIHITHLGLRPGSGTAQTGTTPTLLLGKHAAQARPHRRATYGIPRPGGAHRVHAGA